MKLLDIIKIIVVGAMLAIALREYVCITLQTSNDWYWLSIPLFIIAVRIFATK